MASIANATLPQPRALASLALLTAALLATGCHIDTHKSSDGKSDNVNISTPFGGMHVNTGDAADTSAIGLTAYPGATPLKDDDKDSNSADINMSFGDFHLGVKAAGFKTSDSPDKVLAFYRKDMARYGDVIECRGNTPVGTPTQTSQGLSCSDDHGGHHSGSKSVTVTSDGVKVDKSSSSNDLELRAGSLGHQHIAGVETKDGYTKIGLVMLDLPSHLGNHDSKSSE